MGRMGRNCTEDRNWQGGLPLEFGKRWVGALELTQSRGKALHRSWWGSPLTKDDKRAEFCPNLILTDDLQSSLEFVIL